VERVDDVRVLRVDVDTAVVTALTVSNSLIVGRHLAPRRAAVVGAEEPRIADHEHALALRVVGDRDPYFAGQPSGQSVAGDLLPRRADIEGLEGLRARGAGRLASSATAGSGNGRRVVRDGRREDRHRRVERAGDLLHAGAVVYEKRLSPSRAAVGASV